VRDRGNSTFVVWCAVLATLAIVVISAIAYLVSPNPPNGFTSELGSTIASTSTIAAFVKTLADLADAIGWSGWANRTAFAFSPMTIYLVTVPLAKLFGGNAFEAVKAVQVFEIFLAWLAAAYLYRCLRGRTPWVWVAGGLYALLPSQLLWVRADVAVGMVLALTPFALGASVALLRRWGSWALPFCGVLASLATAHFSFDCAIFVGLPIYAFAVAAAFDRKRPWLWASALVTGLACGIASTGYTIVPTYFSRDIFWPPLSLQSLLAGSVHAPLVPDWFVLWCLPLGALMLTLAIGWTVWAARTRALSRGELALLAAGAACAAFSIGTSGRFLVVAAAVAAVAAISALERLSSTARWRRYAAWLGVAVLAAGVSLLFLMRTFLGDPPVEARASQPPGRVASLAWQPPSPDWELHAAPMPFLAFERDIAQRYAGDGLGGTGVLARASVSTILAQDGTSFAQRALAPVRGYVRNATPVCIGGGPGLLDDIRAMPSFENAAFFDGSFPCTRAIYLDSAPLDQLLSGTLVESFSGRTLFPNASEIAGADDRVAPGRFFINDPWYRNAVDGDNPELSGMTVALAPGVTASALFETDAGPYALAVHAVCHAFMRAHVLRDATFSIPFTCTPRPGFQWLKIPLGNLTPGQHSYSMTVDAVGHASTSKNAGWSVGLDGAVLLEGKSPPRYRYDTAFALSADRLVADDWIAPGVYQTFLIDRQGHPGTGSLDVDGAPTRNVVAFSRGGLHKLRWARAPDDAAFVALVPVSWNFKIPLLHVSQLSSMRWYLRVERKSVVEAAVYPDGYWYLEGNGVSLASARCDLVNTCFGYVEPGRYKLVHRLPDYVLLGFLVTLGAWLAAVMILLYARRRETTDFDIQTIDDSWPLTYFANLGWLIGIVGVITFVNWLRLRELGWMMAWQLIAVALFTLTAVIVTAAQSKTSPADAGRPRHGLWLLWSSVAGLAACVISSLWLDAADHRLFALVVALLQTCAIVAVNPGLPRRMTIWLVVSGAVTWSLASGLSFTHLGDWLLNGTPTAGLAVAAFVASFGFVIYALRESQSTDTSVRFRVAFGVFAVVTFAAFALRTDSLLTEWVPLHRSVFSDVSQFVRDGHWLLWDIPSLYGFFSILTLALIPAKNSLQALYELTAILLVAEGYIAFSILRWGRGGWSTNLFALLFPLATLFNDAISRFPMSGRLYPQGGLRFFWIDVLLFIVFLMYVWREDRLRVTVLRWLGHAAWLISILWSLEAGAWATAVWLGYLAIEALTERGGFLARLFLAVRRTWPVVALPPLAWLAVDLFYKHRLGHAPDWRAYVEYTGLFTSGQVRQIFHVQHLGAGWTFLLVLASVGSLGIAAVRERRWDLVRLLCAAWLAVWATASYYAVEPLDMYVSLLLGVMVPAASIALFASRERLHDRASSLLARYALAPLAVIAIAVSFGEPARMAAMRFPFTPGWHFDVLQDAQPITGDLAGLMQRAGIAPGDAVLIPNGAYWTEPQQGMIQPFARLPGGQIQEYRAWLPTSPVGATILYGGLSPERKRVYLDRFLEISRAGGWYVTYRQPLRCEALSKYLLTVRSLKSENFVASLCAFTP
jgi:hypothetical protein